MPAETSDFSAINSTWQNMLSAMRGDTLIIRATHKPGQVSRQVSASHAQVRSGQRATNRPGQRRSSGWIRRVLCERLQKPCFLRDITEQ